MKKLYHGTSRKELCKLRDAGWMARDLYVTDQFEDDAAHYAEEQSSQDGSAPAYLVLNLARIPRNMRVHTPEWDRAVAEYGSGSAEELQYRHHLILTGPIRNAIVEAFFIDENGNERDLKACL